MNRYARQTALPEVGERGQRRLAAARVLVVGAGGLGAPVLPLLAGAGVGRITIVDGDVVSLSNLHRQTLFTQADCDQPKAQVAAERCRAINPGIDVDAVPDRLTPATAPGPVSSADLVLDCADSYAVSYMLSDLCLAAGVPLITASALGLGGYVAGVCGGAPSLRAVFPDAPENGASCATAGVLGPVVGTVGAMQAQMALNLLLGLTPSPLGLLVRYDGLWLRATSFRFDGAAEPEGGFRFLAAAQLCSEDHIVDLRPDGALLHPQAIRRASAAEVATHLPASGTRLALCCATGLRAWRAAERIAETWRGEIVLVAASAS
ncbi:HesA/MoeB/ThiF family protein [Alloyangia pacifica]|uniref:Molybdopterin or thiamine biosynthesis adenylyltransferase n=1 Tax=Alloyangia pacifica TaxID=311180 RepID=A0A1I6VVI9_9RHOB|nr:HesA/MoeB/ThiF family protein [Alloyangia pacifica]SDI24063.1 Molybdopterin or thiamine biosynthesis adenylyltransferase [Alloyangia pacifica]SFT17709.1 Molybdopterin or thiamine biosynthesis adenylyltransferase [Alloyangia pacifica]